MNDTKFTIPVLTYLLRKQDISPRETAELLLNREELQATKNFLSEISQEIDSLIKEL